MAFPVAGRAEREIMSLLLTTNAELVAAVLRGGPGDADDRGGDSASVIGAIAATRGLVLIVDDILHSLVHQARAEGHTWAEVGDVLHVSRQAAFQRFGGSSSMAGVGHAEISPAPDASDQALAVLGDFVAKRWDRLQVRFSAKMRVAVPEEVSRTARARIEQGWGTFLEFGTPVVTVRDGLTVVDVPMAFEQGDLSGRVAFNVDGEVAGLLAVPPDD